MFAKIEITGMIESLTGMHIGGSSQFAAIGAVDSPVIRDALSNEPMIPGSSLKGKMRTLLAKQYNGTDRTVTKPDDDDIRIKRLFGSADKKHPLPSRLIFSDMPLANADELKDQGVLSTEIKFENTINRVSAVANPRQIERAVRGGKYQLSLIYNVNDESEMEEDFQLIHDGMKLLEYDYIGGNGSRGYGKIHFSDIHVECVVGEINDSIMEKCIEIIKDVM